MSENLKIGIVGAGIQGVCSALFIQIEMNLEVRQPLMEMQDIFLLTPLSH